MVNSSKNIRKTQKCFNKNTQKESPHPTLLTVTQFFEGGNEISKKLGRGNATLQLFEKFVTKTEMRREREHNGRREAGIFSFHFLTTSFHGS